MQSLSYILCLASPNALYIVFFYVVSTIFGL